jgi:hypothetical protein
VKGWHNALSLHKDFLQEISLDCINAFVIMRDHYNHPLPTWPSLNSFTSLKTLKMEYRRTEYAHLPPNLDFLYLFDCRGIRTDAEINAWKQLKAYYCPKIKTFEIMITQDCRWAQRQVKSTGFHWGYFPDKTREWNKDGFLLKIWFKEFLDGTYHFSQVGASSPFTNVNLINFTD